VPAPARRSFRAAGVIFAIPLYDDNPRLRTPLATHVLIGLCVGTFLWQLKFGYDQRPVFYGYGMTPAELFGSWRPPRAYQAIPPWATIFTSMFLHGGWFHLIGNMLFLWIFGPNIEGVLGRPRYLFLYFASGVVAALVQAGAAPGSHIPMIGASGAIAGVLGAYLFLYPRANVHTFVWIVIFFRIVTVPAWLLLGLWFGAQLVSGLGASQSAGVAFWAHVGGFLAGLFLITLLRPSGVSLLQASKSGVFVVRPARISSRANLQRGSVPSAGRRYFRSRGPWD
jgi:membrane associated rhomboid family serine protease